ncbi:MAG: NAD(P)-binding domain-containing protein, partial [Corynebacterium nuruki]|nr:NAD(P)-binding domain-containing protein [Corynebacterium nuruki]
MVEVSTVGFIGVGEIAGAMVEGLLGGTEDAGDAGPAGAPTTVVLSPRGRDRVAALQERFAGPGQDGRLTVASSNAAVAAAAETVVVSVRPEQLTTALDGVEFRAGQTVVSTLAGVDLATLRAAVGDGPDIVRSVPLPPVARRAGITPVIPAFPAAVALFDLLGGHMAVADEDQMAAVTVLTGAQTGLLQYVADLARWAAEHGLDAAASERFVRSSAAGLAPALQDAATPIDDVIDTFETPGGLNWQLRTGFFDVDTTAALDRELDRLHARVRG